MNALPIRIWRTIKQKRTNQNPQNRNKHKHTLINITYEKKRIERNRKT